MYESIIAFSTLAILILSKIIHLSLSYQKLDSRLTSVENETKSLKKVDELLLEEIKTLHRIEGQLEIILRNLFTK